METGANLLETSASEETPMSRETTIRRPAPAAQCSSRLPEGMTADAATVGEHIELLMEQELLKGEVLDASSAIFVIQGLTWEGHDFLQAIQNDTVWKNILSKSKALGGAMTLEIAKELGTKYLKELL